MGSSDPSPQHGAFAADADPCGAGVSAADTLCHVVRIHATGRRAFDAVCLSLPANILAEVHQTTRLSGQPRRWVRELDTLRTARSLSGLVLWFVRDGEPPALPGPIVDRIEPIALDRDSAEVLDALLEGQAVLDQRGSKWWRSRQRGQRVAAWFMRGFWLIWFGTRLVPDVMRWIKTGSVPPAYVLFVTLALATLSLIVLVQRQWFLISQGVLCRPRTTLGARSLERFTRIDSTLLIAPQDRSWMAYVCKGGCVRRRELDDRECLALVAAWQSPALPPDLSQLGDYA